jgi:hypothetical protein
LFPGRVVRPNVALAVISPTQDAFAPFGSKKNRRVECPFAVPAHLGTRFEDLPAGKLATGARNRSRIVVGYSELGVARVVNGSPWPVVGEAPGLLGVIGRVFGAVRVGWAGRGGR